MEDLALGRRAVLATIAAVGVTLGVRAKAQPALRPPPRLTALPEAWGAAPALSIWPGPAPGAADFRPTPQPDNFPPVFLHNISDPQLHVFAPRTSNGRGLLVMPGGSYQFVSIANEGVDVAAKFCPLGYTVFVLDYRLPAEGWRERWDVPLQDAQRAMRLIRARAGRFGLDPGKIVALGFSAGGHLAATLATDFAAPVYTPVDDVDRSDARPSAAAMIYPVITMTSPSTHAQSRDNLLGPAPSKDLIDFRSPEQHVDATLPPIFLAHAFDDPAVPVENSLMMMAATRAARRPVEAHFFQEGGHAFGVGYPGTPGSDWISLLDLWLGRIFATV